MNSLKKYLIALLLLALLLAGFGSVRSFFMANIVEPIALVCWAIWRIVASVNQIVYWLLLIGVCFILFVRLIPSSPDTRIKAAYNYTYQSSNRVNHWKSLIEDAGSGKENLEDLQVGMKKLLLSVIRKSEESGKIDLEEILEAGTVPLSLDAQRFLFPPRQSHQKSSLQFKSLVSFPAWLRAGTRRNEHQDTQTIDEILKWLEMELEIHNDQ